MQIEKPQKNSLTEIPEEGCLGLLALGDIGLLAWREKKANRSNQKREKKNETR